MSDEQKPAVPNPNGPIPPPRRFFTGAFPSPKEKIAAAPVFLPRRVAPSQMAWVADRLDVWNNSQYGDCVTAEECFSKGAWTGHHFIPSSECVAWANRHGFLNGATLVDVLDAMQRDGLKGEDGKEYKNGPYSRVQGENESELKGALAVGPVKLGMASSCLPSGAGDHQGWSAKGACRPGQLDHSTTCAGYGPAGYLAQQYGFALPSDFKADEPAYAYFTWGTVGIVDHAWLKSSTDEWWLRNPTTVGEDPTPPPPPPPPPPPGPSPTPILDFLRCVVSGVSGGKPIWTAILDCLGGRSEEELRAILGGLTGQEHHHCSLHDLLPVHIHDWLHGRGMVTSDQLMEATLDLPLMAVEPFIRVVQMFQMQMGGVLPKMTPAAPRRR